MKKFRVGVIDAMLLYHEISCELKDKNGDELFLGDTVELDGEKFLLGYRYDAFVLLPMIACFHLSISDSSRLTRLNLVTATPDQFLLIGYTSEPIFFSIQSRIDFSSDNIVTKVWEVSQ